MFYLQGHLPGCAISVDQPIRRIDTNHRFIDGKAGEARNRFRKVMTVLGYGLAFHGKDGQRIRLVAVGFEPANDVGSLERRVERLGHQ
jgi:hypothetical protein